jgi:hypothetical protein
MEVIDQEQGTSVQMVVIQNNIDTFGTHHCAQLYLGLNYAISRHEKYYRQH